jgi:hypothetical protein
MPARQAGRPKIAARKLISSSKTPFRENGSITARKPASNPACNLPIAEGVAFDL